MRRALLIIAIHLIGVTGACAQQYSIKDILGRWKTRYGNGEYGHMQFLTDSTAVYITPRGFFRSYINYSYEMEKDIIKLRYTSKINGMAHAGFRVYIKFLNDSTFLFKPRSSFPRNTDTNTKKIYVYRKVKVVEPGTEFRFPDYHNLLGDWKGKYEKDGRFNFLDESHVVQTQNGNTVQLTYKADFTKQPLVIDFYYANGKMLQSMVSFEGDNKLWIELFPKNDRGNHPVLFNPNMTYLREIPIGNK